jgi:hypothetical protein
MARAQFVIEFSMILAVVVVIGMLYLAIATSILTDTSEQQRLFVLNDVGYGIQDEMLLAASVSDGYERTILVPVRADRFDYQIVDSNTTITLTSGVLSITYDLPLHSGTFVKGNNVIRKNGILQVNP